MCACACGACGGKGQLPRATRSSGSMPEVSFSGCLQVFGRLRRLFVRCKKASPLGSPPPQHAKKIRIFEKSAENALMNSSIGRAGCKRGIFGVFGTVLGPGKCGVEAAETTFSKKKG